MGNVRPFRRALGLRRHAHHHASVGALAAGFAPIFAGWNVWDVYQSDDPTFDIMTVGESLDRQLQVWVENEIKDNAPGSAVADPANPAALRGDQIQIIPKVSGLKIAAARDAIPDLAGAVQVGKKDSKAILRTVRFWNRGVETSMPWPHDENYLLDAVYTPSASNSVTDAPQPGSLAGSASAAAAEASSVLKVVAIVGGVVLVGGVIIALASASKKAAA